MPRITAQEWYDRLVQASLDGTFPSFDPNYKKLGSTIGRCLYRFTDAEGKIHRCAIGINLPDEKYHPSMEGNSLINLLIRFPTLKEILVPEDMVPEDMSVRNAQDVQTIHDGIASDCFRRGVPWPHDTFIRRINALPAFNDVVKVNIPA